MDVTVKLGWADKLKAGSAVLVQNRVVPDDWPSTGYRFATVDRVSATEVIVDGVKYRRGVGRSPMIQYPNEGLQIEWLNDAQCGRIWPVNAAVKRAYVNLLLGDFKAIGARIADVAAELARPALTAAIEEVLDAR